MPEREEIDRSHPPAASPQPQNRRQRTAPTQHEFRQHGTPPPPPPPTTSPRRPDPAHPTSVDQPPPPERVHLDKPRKKRVPPDRRSRGPTRQPGHNAEGGPGSGLWQLAPPGRQQPEWRGSRRGDPHHRAAEARSENGGNTGASRDNGASSNIGARCDHGGNNGKNSISNGGRGYSSATSLT
ncbi:hypothetical protein HPB50_010353 [Hyalomma asiaticum]|uniref:Uncharacterized protein n=1 Tax=Hyalomma asiaticum TaxID=266040 RepID=A0ACB7S469_HYAAI|nr:hypothetical protein HPB50_010353 [Hyalomma asiaticum]